MAERDGGAQPRREAGRPGQRARIIYLAHYSAGGAAICLRTLAGSLDRRDYELSVAFHRLRSAEVADSIRALGIPVTALRQPWPRRPRAAARSGLRPSQPGAPGMARQVYRTLRSAGRALQTDLRWQPPLARLLRRPRADLVHANDGLRAHRLDILLCALLGIPVVCHVRGFEQLTAFERWAARRVWRFVYMSQALARDFERQGIPAWQGCVIPDALSADELAPVEAAPRGELGCGPEHFVVANVGRLVAWKGQDVFLQAVAELAPRLPHLRALVVGAADDNEPSRSFAAGLRRQSEALGLGRQVIFTGHRPDAMRVMAAADVVAHTSTAPEPFGRVLLEGLAVGRPVVASDAGGVLDILQDGVTGLLVPPGAPRALARALARLEADPGLRGRLAEAGQRHVREQFSAEQLAGRVTALYRQRLGAAAAASRTSGMPAPV